MDVIILDHHVSEETMPPAFALVNPNRFDESSPYTYLCAAGLTFLFLTALKSRLAATHKDLPDLRGSLDLVALATVCDVVPLVGLNRAYVTQGLKIIAKQTNTGLKALLKTANIEEKIAAYHLGFILGPRINAGGRIGESDLGARLLSTHDPKTAETIAQRLETLNSERQTLESIMLEEATKQVEDNGLQQAPVICVASPTWHMGIVGIIAGRLKDLYHRPCFVIAIDDQGIGKGSGRSIPGVDLGRLAHKACADGLLINGGGHPMAAGITLRHDKLDAFKAFLKTNVDPSTEPPTISVHGALAVSGASLELIDLLDQLSPFGQENPSPNFVLTNVRVSYSSVVGNGHVRCILEGEDGYRIPAIAFREAENPLGQSLLSNDKGRPLHVLGTLKANHWQGQSSAQLLIKDVMLV
jgi:single-stranded-DNA-specific exonuclease